MRCYDTWRLSPDDDSSLHDHLKDEMFEMGKDLICDIEKLKNSCFFPTQKLALVIIEAIKEGVCGAIDIANILGIDNLNNLQHAALEDDYDKYYAEWQKDN